MPKAFDPSKQTDAAKKAIESGEARIETLNERKKKITDRLAVVQDAIDAENVSIEAAKTYLKAVGELVVPTDPTGIDGGTPEGL